MLGCLLGVLALSATLVSSAQAKKLVESGPAAFTDEGQGEAELGNSHVNIKCKSHSGTGKVDNQFGGGALLDGSSTYKGCEAAGKGLACSSAGAKEPGEITTEPLKGEIGWVNKSKNEVGVLYTAAKGSTEPLAVFNCGVVGEVKVFNGVIGKVTSPLNEMSVTSSQSFVEGAELKNDPTSFEAGGGPAGNFFLETEFKNVGPTKFASNQKQSDVFVNKGGECAIKGETEKCKRSGATEISTVEVTCPTPEPEVKEQLCVSSQKARPEYGRCEKSPSKTGKYTDKNCSVAISLKKGKPHKGKYEFEPIPAGPAT